MQNFDLSVIIPFGLSNERSYIKDRVLEKSKFYKEIKGIEFIFVEGFSSELCEDLKDKIEQNGHRYLKDLSQASFSQGLCRNLGVSYAKAKVVTFLDADCHLSLQNFQRLLNLIKIKDIANNANAIIALPVIFLNENFSKKLSNYDESLWDILIQDDLISGKREIIDFFSLTSSSIVVNKYRFLECGGNDKEIFGHSYEDHDFFVRLLVKTTQFEKMPSCLNYDEGSWNFFKFKGFRSWFSLIGFEAGFHGLYLYHFWHIKPNQNGYFDRKKINHKLFYNHLKNFKTHSIKPLQIASAADKKVLLLCKYSRLLLEVLRGASVYIGEILHKQEEYFFKSEAFDENFFLNFLEEQKISYVLFPNPYTNEKRIKIYEFVRANDISYICFDRGALNDSWFFDKGGFNADSNSYDERYWDKNLSEEELSQIKHYIYTQIFIEQDYLEKQDKKQELTALKKRLNLKENKKIVFVPLQVQNDSVVKYFTKQPFTYENFLNIIDDLARKYKHTHIFIAKKHPLSLKISKQFKNLLLLQDDTNFIDLLELCDLVLTLNSGVGVYAMMMKKPCILCADAFYNIKEVNFRATNIQELEELLQKKLNVNEKQMLKFIFFLKNNFYSFGASSYETLRKNGRKYRKVKEIDFYQLIIGEEKFLNLQKNSKTYFPLKSLVFKPYIYEIYNRNIFIKLLNFLIPDFLIVKISHTKFYRLFKKLIYNPKEFVKDSKNPYIKKYLKR